MYLTIKEGDGDQNEAEKPPNMSCKLEHTQKLEVELVIANNHTPTLKLKETLKLLKMMKMLYVYPKEEDESNVLDDERRLLLNSVT